jgi:ubiquitin-like 1-activating enzyme E1 B
MDYHSIIGTYGAEHFKMITESKVLVVGAGGIGCEILKNLALSGFKDIDLIDLDTIDVSNLNRQFLFRPEHVGQPKSVVAAAATKVFNPEVNVNAHHGNIKDAQFGIPYIQKFKIVLNALDNVDARKHVNRLCLAADVPLIDAGTTGYLGQVMPIFKGVTACYECAPKPTQKVYPICTIRSTPDKPVHCIVWAKECYKLLLGKQTSDSMLFEDPDSGDESTYMHLIGPFQGSSLSVPDDVDSFTAKCVDILKALYHTEIEKRLAMDVFKTAKKTPTPLPVNEFETAAQTVLSELKQKFNGSCSLPDLLKKVSRVRTVGWDRGMWTAVQCAEEFLIASLELMMSAVVSELIHIPTTYIIQTMS